MYIEDDKIARVCGQDLCKWKRSELRGNDERFHSKYTGKLNK